MKKHITFCRICGQTCGIVVSVEDDKVVRIAPDKENPHTWRDFCAKGRTAHEVLDHPNRILEPMRREGDRYVAVGWDQAVAEIATKLREIMGSGGPDAIGVYWGNPVGFSSSNPIFLSGLMDAIGTRNRYYVGSVDQNNHSVVATAMYGSPLTMLVPDVDACDCFLLVGTNPAVSAVSWIFGIVPDGWRRVLAAQARGASLIVVDPVRTESAEQADIHIAVRPGEDWALLLAMLKVILDNDWIHHEDCERLHGFEDLVTLVGEADLGSLSARCDVAVDQIGDIAERFARAPRAMCITATGVSHTLNGTIGEWLSNVLNVVTGRIDRPGGRRYERGFVDVAGLWAKMAPKTTGQSRVRGFPVVQGHMPLATMAEDITTPGPNQVRAVLIDAGNPVIAGPDGRALDEAFASLELLVAVDFVQRESHRHADWLIPAAHWLERDDLLCLMSQAHDEPYTQFGPKVVEPPPGVREEWRFFLDLALAMNVPYFGKRGTNTLVRSTRWLARVLRRPNVAFNPRWVERLLVASGRRLKWKDILARPHGWVFAEKEYGNFAKLGLRTPDKRVHVAPREFIMAATALLSLQPTAATAEFPLVLCNRRSHDSMNSWLNELPGLHKRTRSNALEMCEDDADRFGVADGDLVRVTSAVGSVTMPARISERPRRGVVVAAHGWGSAVYDPVSGSTTPSPGANRNRLVSADELDPFSGIPALNTTRVRVEVIDAPAVSSVTAQTVSAPRRRGASE